MLYIENVQLKKSPYTIFKALYNILDLVIRYFYYERA